MENHEKLHRAIVIGSAASAFLCLSWLTKRLIDNPCNTTIGALASVSVFFLIILVTLLFTSNKK